MTHTTPAAHKKFCRDFKKRVNTSRECAKCGALRMYGHGCAHCGAFVLSLLEFGDAMKLAHEKMTPEEREAIKKRTRASVIWEKGVAHRPYDLERVN
jgi:hypothetical protein